MLAVSGNDFYAIYLYADGHIEWKAKYSQGSVGFLNEDGLIFWLLDCEQLDTITLVSNVDIPGMLVFKPDDTAIGKASP